MIYTINETPVQLLGLRRPESIIYNKTGFSIFDDCIEMAYACTLQLGEAKTVNKKTNRKRSSSLKIVSAKQVSVIANHIFSFSRSISAALKGPRKICLVNWAVRRAITKPMFPKIVTLSFDVAR